MMYDSPTAYDDEGIPQKIGTACGHGVWCAVDMAPKSGAPRRPRRPNATQKGTEAEGIIIIAKGTTETGWRLRRKGEQPRLDFLGDNTNIYRLIK